MDDDKLRELFRDAVTDVPPPSFDERSVSAESNRQRVRRQKSIMAGSALGVVLLVGATLLGVTLWKGPNGGMGTALDTGSDISQSGRNGEAAPNEVPDNGAESPRTAQGETPFKNFPTDASMQGGSPSGNAAPPGAGGTLNGCEQADRELAAALAGELPAAAPYAALPPRIGCPTGSIGAAYQVAESGRTGYFSAVVTPPGQRVEHPLAGSTEGAQFGTAQSRGGRQVVVVSEPEPGSTEPPYAAQVQRVADALATRY